MTRLFGYQGIYIVSSLGSDKCYPLAVLRRATCSQERNKEHEKAPDSDAAPRTASLLQVFTSPANLLPIRHELALAKIYYVDGQRHEAESPSHFPFIATCLAFGALTHPNNHFARASNESLEVPGTRHDDDEAIVLDITDPEKPRYCFVWCFKVDSGSRGYFGPIPDDDVVADIPPPRPYDYKVVREETLRKLWPERNWMTTINALQGSASPERPITNTPSDVPGNSFSDMVDSSLTTNRFHMGISTRAVTPESRRELLEYLVTHARKVECSSIGPKLLQAAFAGEGVVDLSPWPVLRVADVATILKSEQISPHVKTVSISSHIEDKDIETLVDALPEHGCEELFVLESGEKYSPTLSIPEAHRALVARVKGRLVLGHALIKSLNSEPGRSPLNYENSGHPISQILVDVNRSPDGAVIGDAMLSPTRLVTGLFNLLRRWFRMSLSPNGIQYQRVLKDIASAFGGASTALSCPSRVEIGHFPGEALELKKRWRRYGYLRPIDHRDWIVLISQTNPSNTPDTDHTTGMIKIGFVRTTKDMDITNYGFGPRTTPRHFVVLDIRQFLYATTPPAMIDGPSEIVKRSHRAREDVLKAQETFVKELEESLKQVGSEMWKPNKPGIPYLDTLTSEEAYRLVRKVSELSLPSIIGN